MPVIGCFCNMDGFSLAGDRFSIPLSHLFYFLPPISLLGPLLHLFSTLGIHWFMSLWCSKAKEGEGSRRYITVTLQNAFPSLPPSLPFPFCLANMLAQQITLVAKYDILSGKPLRVLWYAYSRRLHIFDILNEMLLVRWIYQLIYN